MTQADPEQIDQERFLVLAPIGRDADLTCRMLERAGLRGLACPSMAELCRSAAEGAAGLLIGEEALSPAAITLITRLLERQEPWSDLPILLFTGQGATIQARPPSAQLLGPLGNVSLLDRPIRPFTMQSAARAALRARRRQYAARAALVEQQEAVQLRDQFLAMLGHELRNPLAVITMALQRLEHAGGDGDRYLAMVRHQSAHLGRLVDDLLDVSRVTSGKIVLQRERIDIGALVARSLLALDAGIASHQLTVTSTFPDQPVVVDADPVRIEQIVANLMTNAIKYTPAGGQIRVSVEVLDGQARITVGDNGVGIAPEMLPRVFNLFAQVEGTLDRAHGGMGIGLTLVRTLVELHGGTIEARSDGVGSGTEMMVRLPLAMAVAETATADAAAPTDRAAYDVLIVEDNDDSRELLTELLGGYGHRVSAVGDGVAAVRTAHDRPPGVMLIDIGLPGLDGYDVARAVRRELGDHVYLIAMTGYGQPDDRRRALEAGFDGHFTKPVDFSALRQLLGRTDLLAR